MKAGSPFSPHNPLLQTVWDSTSFKSLQFCPTYYKLSILEGWRAGGVDLEFGGYYASAVEVFKKARIEGKSRDEAQLLAVKRVVEDSWDPAHGAWGGEYQELWRCTGTEKYRNSKGNAAKCPWSHKEKWYPGPHAEICGECGSELVTERQYVAVDARKNRSTLVRTVIWYCEDQPEEMNAGGLHPYRFANGTPAVELSFKLPLPWKSPYGDTYILAGHIDSVLANGDESELFGADNKTTTKYLNQKYWDQFSPDTQVDTYDVSLSILYPDLPFKGFIIEAAQVMTEGSRFASMPFHKTEAQREEHFQDLHAWLQHAEGYAKSGYYPMNKRNCWLCPFKGVCNKDPSKREMYLKAGFTKKHWNPLEER